MAVNISRSLMASLDEGSTDGKYRKQRPDTIVAPGLGDQIVQRNRSSLHPDWNYDIQTPNPYPQVNPAKA